MPDLAPARKGNRPLVCCGDRATHRMFMSGFPFQIRLVWEGRRTWRDWSDLLNYGDPERAVYRLSFGPTRRQFTENRVELGRILSADRVLPEGFEDPRVVQTPVAPQFWWHTHVIEGEEDQEAYHGHLLYGKTDHEHEEGEAEEEQHLLGVLKWYHRDTTGE